MVILDPERCAYCGGCVSVCPTEALTLAETRLQVDDLACSECGNCVVACPMGALSVERRLPGGRRAESARQPAGPSKRRYDVIVVGAGPGGAMAAWQAAQQGLSVLLLEKRQEIGSPVRCAEGVAAELLASLVEPNPRWITAEITRAEITALNGAGTSPSHPLQWRAEGGKGYILERRVFDRALAERAVAAGAEICVKAAVTGVLLEEGQMRGVRVRPQGQPVAGEIELEAGVVIATDGIEAQVGRWAGLDLQLPLADTMVCAQYLLAGIEIDPACTAYTIGYDVAPGGYAWVFPKGEGRANVGLGVQADLAGGRAPLDYLHRFIEGRRSLSQGSPVTLIAGNVPVAPSPARMVMAGLMLVGDAARQVDPLTGGGILNAMQAGRLAGQVAAQAVAAGDVSAAFLGRYQEEWQRTLGRKLQRNYRLRERFDPTQRTDERFLHAFALAAG